MTEIIEKREARAKRHLVDPVAFFVALVAAPIVVAGATFWVLLIPVIAVVMGGPIYLATATPLMLWWLGRRAPNTGEIAMLGFAANLVICGGIYLFELVENPRGPGSIAMMYLIFGSIFAPVWAGVFASLYARIRRPFFAQTV